jgi:ankyrin repeat protein
MGGHVEVARLLLAAGADTEKADHGGGTALTYATDKGHEEIVQLLNQAASTT